MITSTTTNRQKAVGDARSAVLKLVDGARDVELSEVYEQATHGACTDGPALRTAIWDLVSEGQLVIREGNVLHRITS